MSLASQARSRTGFGVLTALRQRLAARPELLLSAVLTLMLGVLVLFPLAEVIRESLSYQDYDKGHLPDIVVGDYTLFHVIRVFWGDISWALFYKPFLHSLAIAVAVTAFSVSAGAWVAWILVRTDVPFGGTLKTLVVVPYMMPSWVLALAWLVVFKNDRIAGTEGLFSAAFGMQTPDWISYGMVPIIICLTGHYFVYAYLLISGAISSVNDELEEAGAIGGLSRFRQFLAITGPLLLPAIGSAVVMTFIRVLGTFGTPALLGLPVRFFTLPTQIYSTLSSRNMGDGFLLALVLVALAIVFIYVNSRLIGVRKSFVTLSGKGFRRRQIKLGTLRWPFFAIIAGSLLCVVILPLGMLFLESIMLEAGRYAWDNLTLEFWIGDESSEPGIFRNEQILRAIWNSLRLGLLAALITGVLGILIGYAVVATRGTFSSKALEGIAFTPYIFPSVALGAIYIGMFSQSIGPIPALYGTFALLVLICTVKALPFTSRTGVSAMMQIDRSLEEVARVHGMRWGRRAWCIVLPLAVSGMISGMLLAYITVMRELSLIILLVTPNTNLLTSLIFDYQLQALTQHTGAATIVLVGLIVVAHLLVRLLSRRAHIAEVSVN